MMIGFLTAYDEQQRVCYKSNFHEGQYAFVELRTSMPSALLLTCSILPMVPEVAHSEQKNDHRNCSFQKEWK